MDYAHLRVLLCGLGLACISLIVSACDRPLQIGVAGGPCVRGTTRDCGVSLGEHNNRLTCSYGVQTCNAGAWSACQSQTLATVDTRALAANNSAAQSSLRFLALTEPVDCLYSPCDPYCRNYLETPGTGAIQTVLTGGDDSTPGWLAGSIDQLPGGIAAKGLVQPCSTADDCQYDTYCRYPKSGSCSHDKCATGGKLESACDPCVADICTTSPQCCIQPVPPACGHDPCATGSKLTSDCSECVTAICAQMPSCCSGSWTSSCVAAVASVCQQTCGCCSGEQGFGGHCYNLETDTKNWSQAKSSCQGRSASGAWSLTSLGGQSENDFVKNWNGTTNTWIGLQQGSGANSDKWTWTNGDPAGPWLKSTGTGMYTNFSSSEPNGTDSCTRMNSSGSGTWDDISCNSKCNWVCEGPPECVDQLPPPPTACGHSPCSSGTALSSSCDPCVAQICTQTPSCCSSSWSSACVSQVASICGNTCQCASGEIAQGERCYFKEETDKSWSAARSSCQARGSSWDLAGISDTTENSFVNSSVIDAHTTWLGFTDAAKEGTWVWASGTPSGMYVASGTVSSTPIGWNQSWKYRANNVDPGATWPTVAFNDSAWSSGNGQLGFGDGDEATVFSKNGPSYYFRKTFNINALPSSAALSVLYDDGFVAYINGTEVSRVNVTNVAHAQYATASAENDISSVLISTTPFVVGTNVLAVIMKMRNAGDTDLSFDSQLVLTTPIPPGGIYQKFATGEPNSDGNCANYTASQAGTWDDTDCATARDSVCEGSKQMIETGTRLLTGKGPRVAVPKGDVWRYLATGSAAGATWKTVGFDDSTWPFGNGQLGFGDGDETTTIAAANPSYYFRRKFNLANIVSAATLSITIDDGFIAYINGTEVLRQNVGDTAHSAAASSASAENEAVGGALNTTPFVVGHNVLAVMVKNAPNSDDISFDAKLEVTLTDTPPGSGGWNAACVSKVHDVCGAICDTADPPLATAECTPWYPDETDPACTSADLSLGVPCDGIIPVCNHGNTTAPAGVRLVHFPGNSQHFPTCTPNLNSSQAQECFTQEPIAPGKCIQTACNGFSGTREIMVNPQGTAHIAECSCRDNWSAYSNGKCQAPACAGGSAAATPSKRPVDIILLVDNSGGMAGEIQALQNRINSDLAQVVAANNVNYRVILFSRFGSVEGAVGDSDHGICIASPLGGNACLDPNTEGLIPNPPFYHFSADVLSHDSWCKLLQAWSTPDELATDGRPWTSIAPTGLRGLLRTKAFKEFLVISDDNIDCAYNNLTFKDNNDPTTGTTEAAEFDAALRALSAQQFGTAQARKYAWHSIVGLAPNTPATTPWPSSAAVQATQCSPGSEAPGTGYQALSVLTGGLRYPSCQNDSFGALLQALAADAVAKSNVACAYDLGGVDGANPDQTKVVFTPSTGAAPQKFGKVTDAGHCTPKGYYYQDDDTVVLCPGACSLVKADPAGRVSAEVGCLGYGYEAATFNQHYHADCPDDTVPQWGFFAYETETAGDSNIAFRARLATTEADLAHQDFEDWMVATSSPDTQVCSISGPSPCPFDIYAKVGDVKAHYPWLEMEADLTPSSDGFRTPLLVDWRFTYSCQPGE